MLSRLASRAVAPSQPLVSRPLIVGVQKSSSVPAPAKDSAPIANQGLVDPLDDYPRVFPKKKEGPERDLVNFPRVVTKEYPDPVRLAFIPEEWFDFFYKKTGVSGPYVFGFGVWTWLLSKEIYVLEHNFFNGLSLVLLIAIVHIKFGPKIAAYADKEIEIWRKDVSEFESSEKQDLKDNIVAINEYLNNLEVYKDIANARRETAAATLEATYREWTNTAYQETKRRLDYQLEMANVERRIAQKNMSSWITQNVLKSITPAQEQETLKKCIADLKSLSAAV